MPLPAGEGVTEKAALAITEAITSEIRRVPGVQLITQQEISSLLGSSGRRACWAAPTRAACRAGRSARRRPARHGQPQQAGETWLFN